MTDVPNAGRASRPLAHARGDIALGFSSDLPLEHFYREARAFRIYDGPSEVHRMVIARNVLRDVTPTEREGPGRAGGAQREES